MNKHYVVLGAGLQGVAAAYDFARFGDADRIVLVDARTEVAAAAADKLNILLTKKLAAHQTVDVSDKAAVVELLRGADVCLSAVPYYYNVKLTQAAISAGCHFCDLGGNTGIVFQQHELHDPAQKAGVTIAPDCGLAPGMANILAVYGMRQLKHPRRVRIRVGGLPQTPVPPLGYSLVFSIEGLTNEYFGKADILRNGKVTRVDTFTELEELEFPEPIGKCEAFMTAGGTSTCPWTFEGILDEYDEKTIRYPGHYEKMKAIHDLGLLDLQPVEIDGSKVIPRKLFHTVAAPRLTTNDPRDVVLLRVSVEGDDGAVVLELIDYYDEATGFTAMQRTTGFGAAIVGIMLAKGEFGPGSIRLEQGVDPDKYVEEMQKRRFNLQIRKNS